MAPLVTLTLVPPPAAAVAPPLACPLTAAVRAIVDGCRCQVRLFVSLALLDGLGSPRSPTPLEERLPSVIPSHDPRGARVDLGR